MKKLVFFVSIWTLTFSVNGQDLNLGVKAGINLASIGGNTYSGLGGFGSKVGFHLGGVAEVPLTNKISIQPELLYSLQGSKWNFGTSNNHLKLNYINLPILGKYHIIEGLSAEAGPLIGFLIATNENDDTRFKTLDFAFAIGASYRLNDHIFFSIRYNKGIANINGDDFDGKNQNNVFQISAGYAF